MKFNLIHLLLGGIAFLVLFIVLNRKFELYTTWIAIIKKYAPFWLICFPPFITYFIICGTFSMLTKEIYMYVIGGLENFNQDVFIKIEKGVEYACSFALPILYFKVLRKEKFNAFWVWTVIITIAHCLTAGYRDPKLIFDPNDPSYLETGPQLLESIQFLDASIPLFSLLFFFFLDKRSER